MPGNSLNADPSAGRAESGFQDLSAISDENLEKMVAATRAARAAAEAAEALARPQAEADISAARKAIDESFDWDSTDQQRRGYK
ncbi:MAG: hypothetical protein A3C93_00595 [Candidatus Lloydbacteria bacterium RIFCSPHIGHO2_02_FULL_54_17]|uniref:Uncharacterized protein n=1 Tax=Candidatus Lloydbacteria bacterium RIFCSPHIGHO2_02_FULL_54_17 TaxID=1798664 RepID=A0A1G2DH10_9BACT|nr:MAG: hypothetical protein A2762_03510 [Candidatus Lloydbacteria bacterium RIFCSPHIGHO2_01_FULL_54_11]OGZ12140.1 MAG: hypothetical protein A3C93_00595 [Candidatus Lloydbacteria bacterium RIFCSPHIGHO2_02_FULL_54_17]OGZ12931.1 MAG: hypothetical protein A2948_01035 [Candidatus Lloydbacteria bacterium RIFCSPLOWO2_01_FULL_54_18]OGZ15930.1 MAG: hypothetical protein A3H76_02400 [Candidatus Lloydbacteria bacterium RIFCSPLOWO2_02_FULL_54_12]